MPQANPFDKAQTEPEENPFGRNLADENPFGKKQAQAQPPQTDRFGQTVSDDDLQAPMLQRSQSKQGRLSSAGGSFARGFGDIIASLPKAVGEGAVALANKFGDDPIWGNPDKLTPEDTASYQMGESIEKWFNKFAVNPQYSEEFWSSQIPQGAGSMVGFLAGGAAGRAAGIPALVTTMGLGATATGVEGVDDYLSTLSKDETADPKTREQALYWNSLLGTSEALPITRILSRLDHISGGGVKKIVTQGVIGGMEELTQEVLQQFGKNYGAKEIIGYDPDRGLFTGTVEAGEVGFTLGFLLNTLAAAIGSRRAGRMRDRGDVTGEGKIELPDMQAPIDAMDAEGVIGEEQPEIEDEVVQQRADDAPPLEGFEDGGQDQTGAVPGVGGAEGLGSGIVPAEEAEAAAGEINYFDNRLKRDIYRGRLKHLVDEELVPGGGIAVIPDHTFLGGESDPRDDQGRPQAPLVRTPSLNPDWYQALMKDSNYTLSVEKVRKAATKAVEGDRLGVKQARVVGAILDHITEERVDAAAFAREQLRVAREARTAAGLPEVDDWYFEDDEYPEDFDGISRAFTELLDQAQQLDAQLAEQVEAMMESSRTDAEVLAGITQLIGEYNGRKSQAGAETLQAAQEQAEIQGAGREQPLAREPALPEPGEGAAGRRPAEPIARPTEQESEQLEIPPIAPERVPAAKTTPKAPTKKKAPGKKPEIIDVAGVGKMRPMYDSERNELQRLREQIDAADTPGRQARALSAYNNRNKEIEKDRLATEKKPAEPEGVTQVEKTALLEDRRRKKQPGRKQERRQVGSKERRKEWMHRKEVEEMEPAERKAAIEALRQEVMIDPLTGLGSRAAWEAVEKMDYIGAIDADSLKFVNDALGEKAGDEMLRKIGKALKDEFNEDAFHPSGDEFKVHGDSMDDLVISLGAVQDQLKSESVTGPGGTMTGLGFSWGIATTEEQADRDMKADKQTRTDEGLRVERGERPKGVVLKGEVAEKVKKPEAQGELAGKVKKPEGKKAPGKKTEVEQEWPLLDKPKYLGKKGVAHQNLFNWDEIQKSASKPHYSPGFETEGRTIENDIHQLLLWREGAESDDSALMFAPRGAGRTTKGLLESWRLYNAGIRALYDWVKNNPDKWQAYKDRQKIVKTLKAGDKVAVPYENSGGVIKRKNKKNWSIIWDLNSDKLLLSPSVLRPPTDILAETTATEELKLEAQTEESAAAEEEAAAKAVEKQEIDKTVEGFELEGEVTPIEQSAAQKGLFDQPEKKAPGKKQVKADIDAAAHEAATSPKNNLPEPTEAQKEAGNYKKGKVDSSIVPWMKGLVIMVENAAHTKRNPKWKALQHPYGYWQGTEAFDGDEVDVFIGPEMATQPDVVHVVDQVDPKTGNPDEHKVMLGFADAAAAEAAYRSNYQDNWQGFSGIKSYPWEEFKTKLKAGFFKNSTPARKLKKVKAKAAPEQPYVKFEGRMITYEAETESGNTIDITVDAAEIMRDYDKRLADLDQLVKDCA